MGMPLWKCCRWRCCWISAEQWWRSYDDKVVKWVAHMNLIIAHRLFIVRRIRRKYGNNQTDSFGWRSHLIPTIWIDSRRWLRRSFQLQIFPLTKKAVRLFAGECMRMHLTDDKLLAIVKQMMKFCQAFATLSLRYNWTIKRLHFETKFHAYTFTSTEYRVHFMLVDVSNRCHTVQWTKK